MSRICWLLAIVLSTSAVSCGAGGPSAEGEDTVTVVAASSLTDAFEQIGDEFEREHPGAAVRFSFGSSSVLARQVIEGAPASVFASADEQNVARVDGARLAAGSPTTFAGNQLVLVAQPGLEPPVAALDDLPSAGVVALCATTAPCGVLADRALDQAGLELDAGSVSRAPNARATLRAVSDGDAAAALVYRTDALAAGDAVETIELPERAAATTPYSAVALTAAGDPDLARDFVEFLGSDRAQAILREHGFTAP